MKIEKYRVTEQYTTPGSDKKDEPKVLWEDSVSELCRKYPRPSDRRMDDLQNTAQNIFYKTVDFRRLFFRLF